MARADRLPLWMVIWLSISIPIVLWDVSFVLLRPASMPGGSLAFLWGPYAKYITVDHSYGDLHDPFVRAQAIISALEAPLGIGALILSFARRNRPLAALLAFAMSAMTSSKTALILMIEVVSGGKSVGHNALGDLVSLYLIPNGVWVIVPILVMVSTGRSLLGLVSRGTAEIVATDASRERGERECAPASTVPAMGVARKT
jgi:hypothetical protein